MKSFGLPVIRTGLPLVLLILPVLWTASCAGTGPSAFPSPEPSPSGNPSVDPAASATPAPTPAGFDDLVDAGRLEAALASLDTPGATDLEGSDRELVKAQLLLGTGDFKGARGVFEEILSRDPGNSEALMGLATAAWAAGDTKTATASLTRMISTGNGSAEAHAFLGDIARERKDMKTAEAEYRKALTSDRRHAGALVGMAQVLVARQKNQDALPFLDRAIALEPDNVDAISLRGRVREEQGDGSGALSDLDRAVELDPENMWTRLDRGRIRLRAGKYEECLVDFDKVMEADPEFFLALGYRGQAYLALARLDDAISDFRRALALEPGFAMVHEALGLALFGNQEYAEAAKWYEKSWDGVRKNEPALAMSALSRFLAGDAAALKSAITRFEPLMDRQGMYWQLVRFMADPAMESLVLDRIAKTEDVRTRGVYGFYASWPLLARGRTQAALRLLASARDLGPADCPEARMAAWEMLRHEAPSGQ